ncbi:MAG TPA: autotransporter-associated beta strand repeat-containing protein [Opitutus sp.]|nr:autotransporter-associated beta strand repeat-containing protein [Opitutus sp.]
MAAALLLALLIVMPAAFAADTLTIGETADVNGDGTPGDDVTGSIQFSDFGGASLAITGAGTAALLQNSAFTLDLMANGRVSVNVAVAWSSGSSLSLWSREDVSVAAPITASGTGSTVSFFTNTGVQISADVTAHDGLIFNNAFGGATSGSGLLTAGGGIVFAGTGDVGTSDGALAVAAPFVAFERTGDVYLKGGAAGTGALALFGALEDGSGQFTSGALTILGSGSSEVATTIYPLATENRNGLSAARSSGASALTFNATTVSLVGDVSADLVTFAHSGAMSGAGTISAATQLSLAGAGDVGSAGAPIAVQTPAIAFNKSGGDAFLAAGGAVALSGSYAGDLTLAAGGTISQSGAITAGGTTTLSVTAANSDILLGSAANDFGAGAPVFAGTKANIRDVILRNTNADAAVPSFSGLTNLRDVALTFDHAGIGMDSGTVRNLSLTAGGAIGVAGAVKETGTVTLKTLNDAGAAINFTSYSALGDGSPGILDVSAQVRNAANTGFASATITISRPAGSVRLDNVGTAGGLSVFAGGSGPSITQSGSLFVGGTASFAAANIGVTGDFRGEVDVSDNTLGNGNINLAAVGALQLGSVALSAGEIATFRANAGDTPDAAGITQTADGAIVLYRGGSPGITFNAGAGAIVLTNDRNDFTGPVVLTNSGDHDASIRDHSGGIVLGASSIGRDLTVTSDGGAITQTGAITTGGAAAFDAGAAAITLTDGGNHFGGAVTLQSTSGDVSLANSAALTLGGSSVAGNLTLTANGAITQTGAITVAGTSGIDAGDGAITLTNSSNSFGGAVALRNTSGNAALTTSGALTVAASSVAGNVALIAGGSIAQTGAITATGGTTTLSVTAANSDILLGSAANDFGAGAPVFAGTLANIRDVSLGNTNTDATPPSFSGLSNLRDVTLTFDHAGLGLASGTVRNLSLTAGGTIGVAGAVKETGAVTLKTLNDAGAGINFASYSALGDGSPGILGVSAQARNAADTAYASAVIGISRSFGSVRLDNVGTAGELSVFAGGPGPSITQSGALFVGGIASFSAANIVVTGDFRGEVNVSDNTLGNGTINLAAVGALQLGSVTLSAFEHATFRANAGDTPDAAGITQTADGAIGLYRGGSPGITFNAGAGAIVLTNSGNDFTGPVVLMNSGNHDASIYDRNALTLGTSTIGGTLTVTAPDGITATSGLTAGALVLNNDATLNGTVLTTGAQTYNGAVTIVGGTTLRSTGAGVALGALNGGGYELELDGAGDSTLGAASGLASLTKSGAGSLTLTEASDYDGATTATGGTLFVANATGSATGTGAVFIGEDATLAGTGRIAGATTVAGTLAPGDSPGLLTFDGDLTLGATSLTEIQLAGLDRGTGYDAIDVGGLFTRDGTLAIELTGDFNPVDGATFDLFDFGSQAGAFAAIELPVLGSGLAWDLSGFDTTGVIAVTVSAVPEPATTEALAGFAALLAAWQWRRRRLRASSSQPR